MAELEPRWIQLLDLPLVERAGRLPRSRRNSLAVSSSSSVALTAPFPGLRRTPLARGWRAARRGACSAMARIASPVPDRRDGGRAPGGRRPIFITK